MKRKHFKIPSIFDNIFCSYKLIGFSSQSIFVGFLWLDATLDLNCVFSPIREWFQFWFEEFFKEFCNLVELLIKQSGVAWRETSNTLGGNKSLEYTACKGLPLLTPWSFTMLYFQFEDMQLCHWLISFCSGWLILLHIHISFVFYLLSKVPPIHQFSISEVSLSIKSFMTFINHSQYMCVSTPLFL